MKISNALVSYVQHTHYVTSFNKCMYIYSYKDKCMNGVWVFLSIAAAAAATAMVDLRLTFYMVHTASCTPQLRKALKETVYVHQHDYAELQWIAVSEGGSEESLSTVLCQLEFCVRISRV